LTLPDRSAQRGTRPAQHAGGWRIGQERDESRTIAIACRATAEASVVAIAAALERTRSPQYRPSHD
jgi:hypothetical protein